MQTYPPPKHPFFLIRLWAIASLLLAGMVLFDAIEEINMIQPIAMNSPFRQRFYIGNLWQSMLNLGIVIQFSVLVFANIFPQKTGVISRKQVVLLFLVSAIGMVIGLASSRFSFCCESPGTYHLGFPLNWLAVPPLKVFQSYYPSITAFVTDHVRIYPWGLLISLNFWLITGLTLVCIISNRQKKPSS